MAFIVPDGYYVRKVCVKYRQRGGKRICAKFVRKMFRKHGK